MFRNPEILFDCWMAFCLGEVNIFENFIAVACLHYLLYFHGRSIEELRSDNKCAGPERDDSMLRTTLVRRYRAVDWNCRRQQILGRVDEYR